MANIDNWLVDEIYTMYYDGMSLDEIATEVGLDTKEVSEIVNTFDTEEYVEEMQTQEIGILYAGRTDVVTLRVIKDSLEYKRNYISFDSVLRNATTNEEKFHVDVYMSNLCYVAYGKMLDPIKVV